MPPVIVAASSALAYAGVMHVMGAGVFAYFVASVTAFGVSYLGNKALGIGAEQIGGDPLEHPNTLLTNEPSNTAAIPVVYGNRRMGGTIVFAAISGDSDEYLHVVYAICEGEIESIGSAYLDGDRIPETVMPKRSGITLSAPESGWVQISLQLLRSGATSATYTGSWEGLQVWAASQPGLEITRGGFDLAEDGGYEIPEGDYTVTIDPYDLDEWVDLDDPQVVAEATRANDKTAVDLLQRPTLDNDFTVIMRADNTRNTADGIDAVSEFAVYTQGELAYADLIRVERYMGADDQLAAANLVNEVDEWTANHRLRGVAYAYHRYRYNTDAFPRGIPTATWDIGGRKIYDPRSELTEWSDNPAACVLDYLTNDRYGRGIPADLIDIDSVIAAANYCDQVVDAETGEMRWTCNGAVLTSRTALENVQHLLSACRGWLVHAGGMYRIILDAPASPVFEFSESNITGAWNFSLGDKKTLTNRVYGKYFDPDNDYQTGYAPADSPALRELDRGLLLEQEITLELTNNFNEAYRHATIALNQSRQGIVTQFAALPEAQVIMSGDVVSISHDRPGWDGKLFRVVSAKLRQQGDVEFTVMEYADAVYDSGEIPIHDPAPNTYLPSPLRCSPPGTPVVGEALYETRSGAGVRTKLQVTWPASPDAYVSEYLVEGRAPDSVSWRQMERTTETEAEVLDIASGTWAIRVTAVNGVGVKSYPSQIVYYEVQGLSTPPSAPAGLSLTAHSYLALLSWQRSPDLDVRIGGHFRVRFAPESVSNPAWDDGQDIGPAVAGTVTQVLLPLLAGTYMVKAVDSSGIESELPAVVETDAPGLFNLVQVGTWQAATAWTGTHDGTEVNAGALRLQESGGQVVSLLGSWESSSPLALDQARRVQLVAEIEASAYLVQDTFDSRTDLIDAWPDFDGAVNGAANAEVWVAPYDDSASAFRSYQRLTAADFYAQIFKFKVVLRSTAAAFNIAVTQLTVTAKEVS